MGQHRPLAAPGRAARVEDRRQVVAAPRGRPMRVAEVAGALEQAAAAIVAQGEDVRRPGGERELRRPGEILGRADEDGRLGVAEEVADLVALVGGVERQVDVAGAQHRQVEEQRLDRLVDLHRDPARCAAGRANRAGWRASPSHARGRARCRPGRSRSSRSRRYRARPERRRAGRRRDWRCGRRRRSWRDVQRARRRAGCRFLRASARRQSGPCAAASGTRIAGQKPHTRLRENAMPQARWTDKRERQYKHIKESLSSGARARRRPRRSPPAPSTRTAPSTARARPPAARRWRTSRPSGAAACARTRGEGGRTYAQLYAEAAKKKVKGRSTMNKAELERAVGALTDSHASRARIRRG